MRKFFDIESETIVTIEQLKKEFEENKKNQPEEFNYSFEKYIENCLTNHNGTLEPIEN